MQSTCKNSTKFSEFMGYFVKKKKKSMEYFNTLSLKNYNIEEIKILENRCICNLLFCRRSYFVLQILCYQHSGYVTILEVYVASICTVLKSSDVKDAMFSMFCRSGLELYVKFYQCYLS